MMRTIGLFLLMGLAAFTAGAQSAKTIPGVFRGEFWDDDWKIMQVSPDGSRVVFEQFQKFYTLHLPEGYFTVDTPKWHGRLSPDHQFTFTNLPEWGDAVTTGHPRDFTGNDLQADYAGLLCSYPEGKVIRYFLDSNYILGMTRENNLLVSSAIIEKEGRERDRINYLIGLRTVEPKTGRVEKVLRTDTLFKAYFSSYIPRLWFTPGFNAMLSTRERVGDPVTIYPLGSDSVIRTDFSPTLREPLLVDDNYIYGISGPDLHVYSIQTGKKLFTASFPGYSGAPFIYKRCYYAIGEAGHLFRYDREKKAAYEEEVTPTGLRTLRTYPVSASNSDFFLATAQWYNMAVAAGPSLVFVPRFRHDGDRLDNQGYVIDLPSGRLTHVIAPFWNPSQEQLRHEVSVAQANKEYEAAQAAKKKAACDEKLSGLGLSIGSTVASSYGEGVLRAYDCDKDVYTIWVPREYRNAVGDKTISEYGWSFRKDWKRSDKVFLTCTACNGVGYTSYKVTRSRTKEVPQGYFSGIETKVTRTWEETVSETCKVCGGEGVVKKYR